MTAVATPDVTAGACAECNGPRSPRARYCGSSCRQKAYRNRHRSDHVLPAVVSDETVTIPGYPPWVIPARLVKLLSRPDSMIGRLQRAALIVFAEHKEKGELPTSLRFVSYELSQRGVIAKNHDTETWVGTLAPSRTWSEELSRATMHLRRKKLVAWDGIVDETRSLSDWYYTDTIAESVIDSVDQARIDVWDGEYPPLVLCESRSLAGVLRKIAAEYLCPIAPTNGQSGGFIVNELVPLLADNDRRQVLYLGDKDHHGHLIEDNTRRYIEEYAGRTFHPGEWDRIAITDEQIETLDLEPVIDDKGRAKYETESLGQTRIQQILRERLDDLLPQPLEEIRAIEEEQRERVAQALAALDLGGAT